MTVTAIDPVITDDELARYWKVFDRADELWPWTADGYDDISDAAQALKNSLEDGRDRPGQAGALIAAIKDHMGDDTAAYVARGTAA